MSFRRIIDGLTSWIDIVAQAIVAAVGWVHAAKRVQLIEVESDRFAIQIPGAESGPAVVPFRLLSGDTRTELPADLAARLRGSQVELVLRSDQFLFRPMELPMRAAEFIDGIVRAQIDRLTPWTAADVVFGCTTLPADAPNRISLTVVATPRARIAPYLQVLTDLGAAAIEVSAMPEGGRAGAKPTRVFEQAPRGALDVTSVRRALLVVLAIMSLGAGLAVTTAQIIGEDLDTKQRDLARRIAERRVALATSRDAVSGATAELRALERRKHETAANVMVLEALSQVLPDHTHLTELRVEGDKLQIIGFTTEAPSLIRLLEQSPHFTRATFFAPTTRSPGEPGERFHIEAHIKPVFVTGL
jgi:general secretion pathway protein L